jgi:hypothetical protein
MRGEISRNDDGPDDRNRHAQAAEEQAPEAAPERSRMPRNSIRSPGTVEARDLHLGVVALHDRAELVHFETGGGKFPHGRVRCRMVGEYCDA